MYRSILRKISKQNKKYVRIQKILKCINKIIKDSKTMCFNTLMQMSVIKILINILYFQKQY